MFQSVEKAKKILKLWDLTAESNDSLAEIRSISWWKVGEDPSTACSFVAVQTIFLILRRCSEGRGKETIGAVAWVEMKHNEEKRELIAEFAESEKCSVAIPKIKEYEIFFSLDLHFPPGFLFYIILFYYY